MKHEVNKPISILHAEFIEQILQTINTSKLPLIVVESVLRDIHNDVKVLAQKQYEVDLKSYKEALDANKSDNN